ncbi:protein of unknown function [Pseudorhizobium banfieldiae]|uniref:Uncharacterized protein n=1 Tax=Pseudorhizobium banfieldiae TaxID=1125847 RepID=L0NL52_9HYPH|nr:protein of unknown function [Pseudorhizobium banfieldiae]
MKGALSAVLREYIAAHAFAKPVVGGLTRENRHGREGNGHGGFNRRTKARRGGEAFVRSGAAGDEPAAGLRRDQSPVSWR